MAVKIMELQLPKFKAIMTLSVSFLMRTKKVPMMEYTMPKPAMTMGSRIGAMPPKLSTLMTSRPRTMVANIVAT